MAKRKMRFWAVRKDNSDFLDVYASYIKPTLLYGEVDDYDGYRLSEFRGGWCDGGFEDVTGIKVPQANGIHEIAATFRLVRAARKRKVAKKTAKRARRG